MVQYLFIGELLIFSLCLIAIQIRTRTVYIWLFSNLVGLCGVFLALSMVEIYGINTKVIGGATILLSSAIKSFAYTGGIFRSRRNKLPNILLLLASIISLLIFIINDSKYVLILSVLSSIFLSLSAIFFLLKSRIWFGIQIVKYIIFLFFITMFPLIYLLFISYPIGNLTTFVLEEKHTPIQVILQSVLVFFIQISFIGLVIGRNARENLFRLRRSIRAQEGNKQSKMREQESAALADERYHLLKMLTHEVRQPMNSAQAALQALTQKISAGNDTPEYMKKTLENASSTLNAIILSISNSILGATLITKGRVQKLELTDVCCVAELALLDIDPIEARRFEKKFEQPVMFTDADPIILRLGVRNLLENAAKYSPRHSKVLLKVETDDEHLTVVISVTNETDGSSMLGPDIFNQARRGVDKKYDGYGLGLYITKEVAQLHRGSLCCQQNSDGTVTFELSLPA
jgi:signal transduction histidine kinase